MIIRYTESAIRSLQSILDYAATIHPQTKINGIRDLLIQRIDSLAVNPYIGSKERYLEHLGLGHRRLVEGHYKIVYRVLDDVILVTDIFDSRQDPSKMIE